MTIILMVYLDLSIDLHVILLFYSCYYYFNWWKKKLEKKGQRQWHRSFHCKHGNWSFKIIILVGDLPIIGQSYANDWHFVKKNNNFFVSDILVTVQIFRKNRDNFRSTVSCLVLLIGGVDSQFVYLSNQGTSFDILRQVTKYQVISLHLRYWRMKTQPQT